MTAATRLVAATLVGLAGVALIVSGVAQRRPTLGRMSRHLARRGTARPQPVTAGGRWTSVGTRLPGAARRFPGAVLADLRLLQRSPEAHAAMLAAAAVAGLFGPPVVLGLGQRVHLVSMSSVVPLAGAVGAAVVAPLVVHASARRRAAAIRGDLRFQLSAYLDVVTMMLAGNVGNEGALRDAAQAGDGRFFSELRRKMVHAEASNQSLVGALAVLGDELQLVELQQIAASASLASSAGAPVSRTLAAKCATLRSALSSEQEAEARVRTGKITVPLVGMSLLIMAAVIYPALGGA